tara:strand:- start:3393 stop:3572 length:180 start_codon:yes stop_codon:yes gene_type:complete
MTRVYTCIYSVDGKIATKELNLSYNSKDAISQAKAANKKCIVLALIPGAFSKYALTVNS